jgi:hypothetical protein
LNRLTEQELARRLPVWQAMADLFLDTDVLGVIGIEAIAAPCRASGYSLDELRNIFRHEVGPAFSFNAMDVAGEWAMWDPNFVRDRILCVMGSPVRRFGCSLQYLLAGQLIAEDWRKIEAAL